jgi:dephospho-CoA kinase
VSAAPQRIGLTGGIGSGKSTVATMLAECGAAIIDADAISKQLTAPGGQAISAIAQHFGPQFIDPDGAMNRDLMRQLAFNDASARQQLEAIIHPLVGDETLRQADRAAQAGLPCIVFDIPLLVESGRWRQQLDRVLVVDCREATQISRVTARSGLSPDAVSRIMAGQATRARRLAAADFCIYNDDLSLEELGILVGQLAKRFGL